MIFILGSVGLGAKKLMVIAVGVVASVSGLSIAKGKSISVST